MTHMPSELSDFIFDDPYDFLTPKKDGRIQDISSEGHQKS